MQFVPNESTPEMRNRLRKMATPPRDDFERAVLMVLDDFDRLERAVREGR